MKRTDICNIFTWLFVFVVAWTMVLPEQIAASTQKHTFRGAVASKPKAQAAQTKKKNTASPQVPTSKAPSKHEKKKTAPAQAPQKASQPTAKTNQKSKTVVASKKPQQTAKKSVKKTVKKQDTPAKTKQKTEKKAAIAQQSVKKKAAPAKNQRKAAATANKDLKLRVKAAFLVNMSNGKIYYEQNPDAAIAPASITKLLTLYLVREAMAQGKITSSTAIPVSARAVRTGGSRMSLKRGEKVPLHELIKGISVVSANNACVAVAEYMGKGDSSKFVSQMNAKAKKIGMTSSRFKNPNGLPAPGQLSTARDIAKLSMSYLRSFPESLSVHSMTTHTYHGATHRNANSLLRTYKGVDGLKTGFVCSSGYNITATAKRGNTRLLAVVLGAHDPALRQMETAKLLDYGFERASMEKSSGKRGQKQGKKKV